MTDDNKALQQDHDEFKFDDDMNQFFDDSTEALEEGQSEAQLTKAQKFKNKFSGIGGKFSSKLPGLDGKLSGAFKNRRIVIAIVFIVLVVIIYMLIGGGSSSPTAKLANGKIQPASVAPIPGIPLKQQFSSNESISQPVPLADSSPAMKIAAPINAAPPVNIANEFSVKPTTPTPVATPVVMPGVSKAQLTSALADLSTKLQADNDKQLQGIAVKLDAQYVELSAANQRIADQMNQLQQQLTDLKADVTTSHNNIKNLQGKVSDIENGYTGSFNANGATTYQNVPKPQPVVVLPNAVTYVVQAIVPGRAWLYGSNGQTVSVGVGDKIEGYGNVMNIDSLTGTVTMNNGAVLKPGA